MACCGSCAGGARLVAGRRTEEAPLDLEHPSRGLSSLATKDYFSAPIEHTPLTSAHLRTLLDPPPSLASPSPPLQTSRLAPQVTKVFQKKILTKRALRELKCVPLYLPATMGSEPG